MSRPYAAKLQELLHASYNLPNAVCDLGRVELGPSELEEVTRRFYAHDQGGIDAKAHYLLAASGFDAEQVLSEIANIRFRNTEGVSEQGNREAQREVRESHKSLPHEKSRDAQQEAGYTTAVDPIITRSARDFDDFVGQQLQGDWAARKRELMAMLTGNKDSSSAKDTGAKWSKKGILGPSTQPTTFTPAMRAYAEIVTAFCDADFHLDLVKRFASAGHANAAPSASQNLRSGSSVAGGTAGYIGDSWRALEHSPLAFLELQYREYIDSEIRAHRRDAKLGGVPSSLSKVQAFVAAKYQRHGAWDSKLTLINKTPIWAYLYYLVRAGHVEEALQLVLERKDIFETLSSSFAVYFKAWVDAPGRKLPQHYKEMIHAEYHQLFRPNAPQTDPYKQALYKIVGRCDLAKRTLPLVATTTEDWLWLQLQLVEPGTEYTLEDLRSYILDIGPSHLASDPYKYFTVLVLLGLDAEALLFLKKHDEVHTVHFAIALSHLKRLSPADTERSGFNSLVGHYTRHFRQAMPSLAVNYIVLLALPQTQESFTETHEALQELVLETRRFAELLGDVTAFTEHSVPGSIEKRMSLVGLHDKREYLSAIAHGAATRANDDGRVVDAILLFRLAEEPARVLELVNTQLGLLLSSVPLGQPVSATLSPSFDILQLARNVMRIDGDALGRPASAESRNTCMILLAIAECLDLLAQHEFQSCLERISQTGLLVLSPEPAVVQVRELAQKFMRYDESIARNIPYVLVMAMTCIIRITEQLRTQGSPVVGRLLDQYRGRANNCMIYAGLIQFRMPREVYAKLTQLEAELA